MVQHPHHQEQECHQDEQCQQRRGRPAAQNPVIDLQHEDRASEQQQIDKYAENENHREQRPVFGAGGAQFGAALLAFSLVHRSPLPPWQKVTLFPMS